MESGRSRGRTWPISRKDSATMTKHAIDDPNYFWSRAEEARTGAEPDARRMTLGIAETYEALARSAEARLRRPEARARIASPCTKAYARAPRRPSMTGHTAEEPHPAEASTARAIPRSSGNRRRYIDRQAQRRRTAPFARG